LFWSRFLSDPEAGHGKRLMEAAQIFAIIFSLLAIGDSFLKLREGRISKRIFFLWLAIWLSVVLVAFYPGVTIFLSGLVGIQRGIDFAVYSSILLLFYLIFLIYVRLDNLEKNITTVVREVALNRKK